MDGGQRSRIEDEGWVVLSSVVLCVLAVCWLLVLCVVVVGGCGGGVGGGVGGV